MFKYKECNYSANFFFQCNIYNTLQEYLGDMSG